LDIGCSKRKKWEKSTLTPVFGQMTGKINLLLIEIRNTEAGVDFGA
jgi:hypothetical protein